MTFVILYQGNNRIAETCGTVTISEKHIAISVCPEDQVNALKLVHSIDGALFYPDHIVIPISCVNHMAESSQYNKEYIHLTT